MSLHPIRCIYELNGHARVHPLANAAMKRTPMAVGGANERICGKAPATSNGGNIAEPCTWGRKPATSGNGSYSSKVNMSTGSTRLARISCRSLASSPTPNCLRKQLLTVGVCLFSAFRVHEFLSKIWVFPWKAQLVEPHQELIRCGAIRARDISPLAASGYLIRLRTVPSTFFTSVPPLVITRSNPRNHRLG